MNVCVVGNGPSADGRGADIDACDFVVRLKGWWNRAAADAGSRIDAWAWYGCQEGCRDKPEFTCEHWFTHSPKQTQKHDTATRRARRKWFDRYAEGQPVHVLTNEQWTRLRASTGRDPSTGMVAIGMAIERFPDCHLHLYGFDSTTTVRPNFCDARGPKVMDDPHGQIREKRQFRLIVLGEWLGKPTKVTLTWPDMPRADWR